MDNQSNIPLNKPAAVALNYERLRMEGLAHLQKSASEVWTDHNYHDPGITILEYLCYAITEVSLRAQTSIQDLLASDEECGEDVKDTLYPAEETLPVGPITIDDYRRLLIDIDGVLNAWLAKVEDETYTINCQQRRLEQREPRSDESSINLRGLYRVQLETKPGATSAENSAIEVEAKRRLNAHRNLCEDFVSIKVMTDSQVFRLCADVQLEADADVNRVHANLIYQIQEYLTPHPRFYTFGEMLQKGYRVDEVLQGPLPSSSTRFLDPVELEEAGLRERIYLSDIIRVLMSVSGVSAVQKVVLVPIGGATLENKWTIEVEDGKRPEFDPDSSAINYRKGHLPLLADDTDVEALLASLREAAVGRSQELVSEYLTPGQGERRSLGNYRSVQYDFPRLYHVGDNAVPGSAPLERGAYVKQLKAYLLFFDQLLANYIAQLTNIRKLYAISSGCEQTYFVKLADEWKKLHAMISESVEEGPDLWLDSLKQMTESEHLYLLRRNKFLDHLLARFGERLSDHLSIVASIPGDEGSATSEETRKRAIAVKEAFLAEFPTLGYNRARSFDYTDANQLWNCDNVATVKRRICYYLGIDKYTRRNLSQSESEGLFFVEHIILRPQPRVPTNDPEDPLLALCPGLNCDKPELADPYSFRLSVILPAFAGRFRDMAFRRFAESVIRSELPAHILPRVCWLDKTQMRKFERTYKAWLDANASWHTHDSANSFKGRGTALKSLIDSLQDMSSVYPVTKLWDCEGGGEVQDPLILDSSQLGSMEE